MEIEKITQELKQSETEKYVKFISDKGENSCKTCLQYHGQIFKIDAPQKPKIPLHPNCRCKYENVDSAELREIRKRIDEIVTQLRKYTAILTTKAHQAYNQAENIISQAENIKNKIDTTIISIKVSALIILIQSILFAMEKVKVTIGLLQSIIQKMAMNIINFEQECAELQKDIVEMKDSLKRLHYLRLKEIDQHPKNLPKNPQEAIKRGFILAPDSQNRYHRNKGQRGNKKYYHPITGQEVVFDERGNIVTDPENIGTKNYGPEPVSLGHYILDILPYHIWANSENDSTPLMRRIFGSPSK